MAEQNALGQFLPALKGEIAVQYGYAGTSSMLETSDIEHKFILQGRKEFTTEFAGADDSTEIQSAYM